MLQEKFGAVVLAAGFGQINTGQPKVLESFNHKSLVQYPLDELAALQLPTVVVVNSRGVFGHKIVCALQPEYPGLQFVWQDGRRGPADAFHQALPVLRNQGCTDAVCVFGDMPFVSRFHVRDLLLRHQENEAKLSISTWKCDPAHPLIHRMWGYAHTCVDRTSEDGSNNGFPIIRKYRDYPEAGAEVLSSVYVINLDWFKQMFPQIPKEDKGDGYPPERHLPSLVELAGIYRPRVVNMRLTDDDVPEILGVNTSGDWDELVQFANAHPHVYNGRRP